MPKKCPICKQYIKVGEETIPFKDKTAHLACFNGYIKGVGDVKQEKLAEKAKEKKEKKPVPKIELKEGLSEEEYQHKKMLYNYIKTLLDTPDIPSSIFAILKNQMATYGYTFLGSYNTLKYLNEIKCMQLTDNIVGIIPYYYDEAERYYKEVESIEQENKDKNIKDMYKEKVIIIKPKKRVPKFLSFDDED